MISQQHAFSNMSATPWLIADMKCAAREQSIDHTTNYLLFLAVVKVHVGSYDYSIGDAWVTATVSFGISQTYHVEPMLALLYW